MSYAERTVSLTVSGAPSWWTDPTFADRTWRKVAMGASGPAAYQRGARVVDVWAGPTLTTGSAADIDGQRPNVYSYSGGCVDQTRGEFWIHGGGHTAYPGNEPYVCALRQDVPAWRAACLPSSGSATTGSAYAGKNGAGQYDADYGRNGAPQSSHTYHRLVWANDRMWLPGLAGMQVGSGGVNYSTSKVFWFDRLSAAWQTGQYLATAAQGAAYNAGFFEESSCVYIPQDDVIWVSVGSGGVNAPALWKLDARTGATLAVYTDAVTDGWWQTGATLIAGTRYILCRGNVNSTWGLHIFDAANPTATRRPVNLTVSGVSGSSNWATNQWGAVWHAASNSLLVGSGQSENFVKITPNSPTAYTGAWTATTVTPSNTADSSRVIPDGDSVYAYGRWNLVNDMGNGQSAIVFHPAGPSKPVYVYKLPAGEL